MIVLALVLGGLAAVVFAGPIGHPAIRRPGRQVISTLAADAVRRVTLLWRKRARTDARRRAAAEFVLGLSSELSAGLPLEPALERAAAGFDVCPSAVGAVRVAGDVPAALRLDASTQELPVLAALATVWQVSQGSGAGLAAAARRVGEGALAQERMRRELAAEMAGPMATAKVLAVLPAVGLFLGAGLGGSPFRWLLGTPVGFGVLVLGVGLDIAGLTWMRAMVRKVERRL